MLSTLCATLRRRGVPPHCHPEVGFKELALQRRPEVGVNKLAHECVPLANAAQVLSEHVNKIATELAKSPFKCAAARDPSAARSKVAHRAGAGRCPKAGHGWLIR